MTDTIESYSLFLLGLVLCAVMALRLSKVFWVPTAALLINPGISHAIFVFSTIIEVDNLIVCGYWTIVLVLSLPLIHHLSKGVKSRAFVILLRKFFHLVVLALFLPLLVRGGYSRFISIAGVSVLAAMVLVEALRIYSPVNSRLRRVLTDAILPLLDAKDTGSSVVTSHMELLVASVGPCWLNEVLSSPFTSQMQFLLAGLLTVGIGDSAAAIGGLSVPHPHKLKGSNKTFEGMLSFCISVMVATALLDELKFSSVIATATVAVVECYVKNYDNIILPIVFSFILVACSSLGL